MALYVLIIGLCLCALTTGIFLHFRLTKGGVVGVLTKTIASFCFIVFALFLSTSKVGGSYYGGYTITFLLVGLVCGLIGDILLDLKVIYPFHKKKYLAGGMTAFSVGHIFNISGMILLALEQVDLFSKEYIIPLAIIAGGCLVLTLANWIISIKVLKFNFEKFTGLVNIYSFILFLTTALSVYLSFIGLTAPVIILAIGFVLFLASDLILSMQYFGGKQDSKPLTFINHLLYYAAQIIIAAFIYFI